LALKRLAAVVPAADGYAVAAAQAGRAWGEVPVDEQRAGEDVTPQDVALHVAQASGALAQTVLGGCL